MLARRMRFLFFSWRAGKLGGMLASLLRHLAILIAVYLNYSAGTLATKLTTSLDLTHIFTLSKLHIK